MKPLCRHCLAHKVSRPRGLCWRCYYMPGVVEQYPSTSKFGQRGIPDFEGRAKQCTPTTAKPGTPEKVAVPTIQWLGRRIVELRI